MYWEKILKEVLNENPSERAVSFTNLVDCKFRKHRPKQKFLKPKRIPKQRRILRSYLLGNKFPGIYFTQRESECMTMFLQGKTVESTAASLNLSPRTVEFYLKNMKIKLNCENKNSLVKCVKETDFIKQIDVS